MRNTHRTYRINLTHARLIFRLVSRPCSSNIQCANASMSLCVHKGQGNHKCAHARKSDQHHHIAPAVAERRWTAAARATTSDIDEATARAAATNSLRSGRCCAWTPPPFYTSSDELCSQTGGTAGENGGDGTGGEKGRIRMRGGASEEPKEGVAWPTRDLLPICPRPKQKPSSPVTFRSRSRLRLLRNGNVESNTPAHPDAQ